MPDARSIPALSLSALQAVLPNNAADAGGIVALTRGLAAGDETAFRRFHAQYFDRLYRFLLVVTHGQEHAAQDALQETLLRVIRHARAFEHEEVFWSWLKAIARNAARDGGRRRRRYLAVLERFAFWRDAGASRNRGGDDDAIAVGLEQALAGLAPVNRELIEGKYLRGDTVVELAARTGLTIKAVESRLVRIRRQLADTLLEELRKP